MTVQNIFKKNKTKQNYYYYYSFFLFTNKKINLLNNYLILKSIFSYKKKIQVKIFDKLIPQVM